MLKDAAVNTELTLRDYVAILRRWAWLVVVCMVVALALAVLWSALQTPRYQSSARVLINQSTATDIFDPASGTTTNTNFAAREAATAVELIESQLVDREAEARLGFEARISARAQSSADIVVLTATDVDPFRASQIAQNYAEAYLDIRRTEFTEERLATAEELRIRILDLEAELEQLEDPQSIARQQALRDDLADSYDRLIISANLGNNGSARIIDDAQVPDAPFTPRTNRNLILAGVLGLILGAGGALAFESLDTRITSRQVMEAITPGLPSLASIPALKFANELIAIEKPDSLETEPFRTLRASIEFATVDRAAKVIQITSPGASAGKTTIAANLAVVMAQAGQRVAVVDCDMRRPRLHTLFGIDQVPGISSVIIGRTDFSGAAHALDLENGRLDVFASGPIPPGPSELLGSERARTIIGNLRQDYDVVVVDSAPILPVADSLVLSRSVDATIIVANAKGTKRDDVARCLEQLSQAGAAVVGTVLNGVKANAGHGYGYGYGYGYSAAPQSSRFRRASDQAPGIEGTEVLDRAELPQLDAARATRRGFYSIAAGQTPRSADSAGGPSWLDAARSGGDELIPNEPVESRPEDAARERSAKRRLAATSRSDDASTGNGAGSKRSSGDGSGREAGSKRSSGDGSGREAGSKRSSGDGSGREAGSKRSSGDGSGREAGSKRSSGDGSGREAGSKRSSGDGSGREAGSKRSSGDGSGREAGSKRSSGDGSGREAGSKRSSGDGSGREAGSKRSSGDGSGREAGSKRSSGDGSGREAGSKRSSGDSSKRSSGDSSKREAGSKGNSASKKAATVPPADSEELEGWDDDFDIN